MDIKTKKIMTMNGGFHPRLTDGRLYLKRYEDESELLSMKVCVLAETKSINEDIKGKKNQC